MMPFRTGQQHTPHNGSDQSVDEQGQMHLQYVRDAVAQGIADADAGRFVDGKTFMQELKKPYFG
ncbi:MAG: hypothetical protein ACK5UY_05815 [Holosporales bacterium]